MKKNLKFLLVLSSLNCMVPQAKSSAVYEMCEEVIKNNLSYSFNMTVDYLNEHNISNTIPIAVGPNLQEYCNEIIKNSTYYVRLVNTFLPSYTLDNSPNAAEWGTFGITVVGVAAAGIASYYAAKDYRLSKTKLANLVTDLEALTKKLESTRKRIDERIDTLITDNDHNHDKINNKLLKLRTLKK